jgi:hypothetical protein
MAHCAHCGVEDCQAKFHECLVHDFTDPDYGAVHHLTVGTYMLQHNAYADEITSAMAAFVLKHLETPPDDPDKREIRRWADGAQRVARRGPAPPVWPPGGWSLSIGDVDLSTGAAYCATVKVWAEAVARVLASGTQTD